ncbi:MAG TPA: COX15/CtaA family protein [Verrucomicrobiae bacterium]|nr:COX15/CtaA family protein [Verrucomicrobiae bacterium]
MKAPTPNVWLHRFAVFTALATLGLIGLGGLVTSHGVGMAVPDWPTSYGYNMFALPFSIWFTGGVFHEHTHRQWASCVGVLVVILTRWLGGEKSRWPLLIVGGTEFVAGLLMFKMNENLHGAGGFLSGIGGVVILAGIAWFKNAPAAKPLSVMGWWAFGLVQLQGLLGGLRVVLDARVVAGMKLGTVLGIFHACLAQGFFVLLCAIALLTSGWWKNRTPSIVSRWLRRFVVFTTVVIFLQLTIGATMRHQHAGLSIRDFPMAYGKLWPDMSAQAVASYNAERIEVTDENPITAFQIGLQMVHRMMAVVILLCVATVAWKFSRYKIAARRLAYAWLGLIFIQIGLGAWTIWSDKAADVATLHVLVGAVSLVTGAMLCIILAAGRTKPSSAMEFAGNQTEALKI